MITFGVTDTNSQKALAAFFCLPDTLAMTLDAENRISAVSSGLLTQLGFAESELVGKRFEAFVYAEDAGVVKGRLEEVRGREGAVRFAARLRCANGRYVALAWSAIAVGDGSLALSAHEIGLALAESAQLAPELTDRLTGLPALPLFLERVEHAIERARRNPNARFALVSLGLDRFHLVNHRFGYWAGDLLLAEVAQRLRRNVRPTDMVARVGGDEFCVLLEDIRDASSPLRVVQRWRERILLPFQVGGIEITWSFSAGVAVVAYGERLRDITPEGLLSEAQLAMRQAKVGGGAATVISDPTLHLQVQQRLDVEQQLRAAIAQEAFEPFFQPIVRLSDREMVGFEALMRWNHPQRGIVPPGEFIAVAEESGLIDPIGRQAIAKAFAHLGAWRNLPGGKTMKLAINISPRQLLAPGFARWLTDTVAEMAVPPEVIELEITESVVLDQGAQTLEILRHWAASGFAIVLDDFGTGYSSLSCLHQLPVSLIKIDRGFVQAMESPRGYDFVRGVVGLAHTLGLEVVCEGIENERQHELLRHLGAEYGQGYWYSRPVAANQAEAMWVNAYT
ncbi:MAG: GGDEF domain-containing protein [Hydrogenophilus sp.]|nr:GGDEF domain-containing protein [Hydrogenophilus sp.]